MVSKAKSGHFYQAQHR